MGDKVTITIEFQEMPGDLEEWRIQAHRIVAVTGELFSKLKPTFVNISHESIGGICNPDGY